MPESGEARLVRMHGGKRVFQIGFSRCGTSSLYRLFHSSGVPAIHWDTGKIAARFIARQAAGEDPFLDYPDITCFCDIGNASPAGVIEPFKEFRYIFQFYPTSYFILNVRDVQRWLLSRCNHVRLVEWHMKARGISTLEELLLAWTVDWHRHARDVRAFFADKPGQLIVFDIERDDPRRIAEFVKADFTLDPACYARSNETKSEKKRFATLPNYLVRTGGASF